MGKKKWHYWIIPFVFIKEWRSEHTAETGNIFNIFYSIIGISIAIILMFGP